MAERKENELVADKNYKDTLFRVLFHDKSRLLSLYNAVNGTNYTDLDALEINTIQNLLYLSMRNDVSCIVDMRMNLYEHQSTVNQNMPVRNLFYVARLYREMIPEKMLYGYHAYPLPAPKFVVFYNGKNEQPERCEMRLSDAYMTEEKDPYLELRVLQLNINEGNNDEIKDCCETLKEYMLYVDRVKKYTYIEKMTLNNAVARAVDECIEEGILADFLSENREEVVGMCVEEWNQELFEEVRAEEAYEDGFEEGRRDGFEAGRQDGFEAGKQDGMKQGTRNFVVNMLTDQADPNLICKYTGASLEYVYQIKEELAQCLCEEGEYQVKKQDESV